MCYNYGYWTMSKKDLKIMLDILCKKFYELRKKKSSNSTFFSLVRRSASQIKILKII